MVLSIRDAKCVWKSYSLRVSVYIYVCVCVYLCISVCICMCMHVYVFVLHIYAYICSYRCICASVCSIYVWVHLCVCVCVGQKTTLGSVHLGFREWMSLADPGTCWFGLANWPMSPWDPPVCTSVRLELQAHTTVYRFLTWALAVNSNPCKNYSCNTSMYLRPTHFASPIQSFESCAS